MFGNESKQMRGFKLESNGQRKQKRPWYRLTVSIEAATGITTGISAADRARTISVASKAKAKADDIVSPGHIFPVRAVPGGVLSRTGHTEGSTDLCRLAGLTESAVICEVMNEDGTMARKKALLDFSHKHNIKIGTIADLINYRILNEKTVEKIEQKSVKTESVSYTHLRAHET